MKLEANIPGNGVWTGPSASPLNRSFEGDYTLRMHVWQNFNGPFPAGGSGSTQLSGGGIGARTATAQFPNGTVDGILFAATGDGANAQDYRAYVSAGLPLNQVEHFSQQSGTTAAGTQAMAWHLWEITKIGNTVTWEIDHALIATVDVTDEPFAGSNIYLSHFDLNGI